MQMCQMYRHTFVPYAEVTHCTTAVRLYTDCRLQNDLTSNPARSTRATDLVNRAIFVLLTRHKTEKFAVSISALVTLTRPANSYGKHRGITCCIPCW